jgi:hypothetical protein
MTGLPTPAPARDERTVTAWDAFLDGWKRVAGAPALVAGALVLSLALGFPLAAVLRGMIAAHLGSSLAAETAASGVNWDWWQEFSAQASGIGTTFSPSVIGFATVLQNLSDLLDSRPLATAVAGAIAAWLVAWSFLAGGVLDRYARNRRTGTHGFSAACGVHFFRLLRLGTLALAAYALLFAYLHPALFDKLLPWLTRSSTVERNVFALRVVFYLLFGLLLVLVNVIVDYARVRLVVEDRHSAVGAIVAAGRFVARHPGRVAALYAFNTGVFLLVILGYGLVAPGAGGAWWTVWWGLLVGEIYIVARLAVKLQFYASQTALFQGLLAHAGYIARPATAWPESPAAEAIRIDPAR